MLRTSFYVSQAQANRSFTGDTDAYEDNLFRGQAEADDSDPVVQSRRKLILKWLKECSASNPSIYDGMEESIVEWFLLSGHLIPQILNLKKSDKVKTLADSLKLLVDNHCLTNDTIAYLKKSVEDAPPPYLIWRILDDVHQFALERAEITVPLTKTIGSNRPVLFESNVLSQILLSLGLRKLPRANDPEKAIVDDPFRNGQFLLDLYSVLTREETPVFKTAVSQQRAIQVTKKAIQLLVDKDYIDQSFLNSAPLIVSGDLLALQQLISMIIWNVAADETLPKPKPNTTELNNLNDSDNDGESQVRITKCLIKDGVALPKLLTSIDKDYINLNCIFAEPENDAERKWNVRKSVEFLARKADWPIDVNINPQKLFDCEEQTIISFLHGIICCYKTRFSNDQSIESLKKCFGLSGLII